MLCYIDSAWKEEENIIEKSERPTELKELKDTDNKIIYLVKNQTKQYVIREVHIEGTARMTELH